MFAYLAVILLGTDFTTVPDGKHFAYICTVSYIQDEYSTMYYSLVVSRSVVVNVCMQYAITNNRNRYE